MNTRLLVGTVAAVGVFLGLNVVALRFETKRLTSYNTRTQPLTVDTVRTLDIVKQNGSVHLVKPDRDWMVMGKKARASKIEGLIKALFPKDPVKEISTKKEQYQELGVTSDGGVWVKVNNETTILVGQELPGEGVYVRFDGDEVTYLLRDFPLEMLTIDPQDWFDKTIVALDERIVTSIRFVWPRESLAVTQTNGKWHLADDAKEVRGEKWSDVISTLYVLSASLLALDEQRAQYPALPSFTVAIDYLDKKETLAFYKGQDNYLVIRGSDQEKFVLPSYLAEKFLLSAKGLF